MKKLTTLFKKDPHNFSMVIDEVAPENMWVFEDKENAVPTRKFDGTACAIINGELYKRYDAKKGKQAPHNAIPCQEADPITGHHPHWILCDRNKPDDKYHFEAFDKNDSWEDGTYELCGEKIGGNHEKIEGHLLIRHGCATVPLFNFNFETIKEYLSYPQVDIEGIVFHHKIDGRMCKIRKKDFGIKR